ncbi:hypothetical protein TNCV_353441 [Trichonephila clavipes]|nr:hypothetical protein TNCV_353441 [Trichonephila clavipes]
MTTKKEPRVYWLLNSYDVMFGENKIYYLISICHSPTHANFQFNSNILTLTSGQPIKCQFTGGNSQIGETSFFSAADRAKSTDYSSKDNPRTLPADFGGHKGNYSILQIFKTEVCLSIKRTILLIKSRNGDLPLMSSQGNWAVSAALNILFGTKKWHYDEHLANTS